MSVIFVNDREGNRHELKAEEKLTLMEIIRDGGLDIEAACGGCCACATCHVYVDEKWFDKLKKKDEAEQDMLDMAFEPNKFSRLSCQISVSDELDGMAVKIPSKQA